MATTTHPGAFRLTSDSKVSLPPEEVLFGRSPLMQSIRERLEKVAHADVPVLIQGESGTGKEIMARLVHSWSVWKSGPFVKVNCPAIPGTLVESELFGYERGAFTGANGTKPGRVEQAQNGTLFLDEIAELEPGLQAKLLQLLQDGQFCPIGGNENKKINARVICATNRNLEEEIQQGTFRQDLFYRINVVNIQLPSLRDRSTDIPFICDHLRRHYNEKFGRAACPISEKKMTLMQRYRWPGNIRELENLMKRYVILGSEEALALDFSIAKPDPSPVDLPIDGSLSLKKLTREATREFESKIIFKILQAHNWNRKRAASALNISYRALLYKLKEAGVPARKSANGPQVPELSND